MSTTRDLEAQRRFQLGMQLYRDAVEVERMRVLRENPHASKIDFESHMQRWHLKPNEWVDPAFRVRPKS